MELEDRFTVAAPLAEVWRTFLDPAQLGRAVPGCEEVTRIDETRYEAVLSLKVQFMTLRSRAHGTLLQAREPDRLVVEMVGEPISMAGAYRAVLAVDLIACGDETEVHYLLDLVLLGRLASLGEALVRATARRQAAQFAQNLSALFAASEEGAL